MQQLEDDIREDIQHKKATEYSQMTIGINDNSLATWFLPVIIDDVKNTKILLDLKVDDQTKLKYC
ncbi:MAG: hypothetical protein MJB14_17830 [Spirochaetes bacterium]|nr:hypothetical protein [Spirochaetota bacterium]